MKVLIVTSLLDNFGGSGAVVQTLVRELTKTKGVSVATVSLSSGFFVTEKGEDDVLHFKLGRSNPLWFGGRAKWGVVKKSLFQIIDSYNIFSAIMFYVLLLKYKPNVVHFNKFKGFSPLCVVAAKFYGAKVVLTSHDYEMISPDAALSKKEVSRFFSGRFISSIYLLPRRAAWACVDAYTAPSKYVLDKVAGIFCRGGVSPDLHVIRNPVEIYTGDKPYRDSDSRSIKLLFLGRLVEEKGVRHLVEAMRSIQSIRPDITLDIYGYGPLESLMSDLPGNSRFNGKLEAGHKFSVISEYDYMIVPSTYEEPFGLVVIESYSVGVPVIGSSVGGLREIVDAVGGPLITQSGNDLENVLCALDKPSLYCRKRCIDFSAGFSPKIVVKEVKSLYEHIE